MDKTLMDELIKDGKIIQPLSEVKILKEKKGVPTVIEYIGKKYVLHHSDQFKR